MAPQWEFQRDGRYGLIPYEQFGNRSLILWNRFFPFIFTNQQEQKSSGKDENNSRGYGNDRVKVFSTILYIRGTLDVEKIMSEACAVRNEISWEAEEADEEAKTRFVIHHVAAARRQR